MENARCCVGLRNFPRRSLAQRTPLSTKPPAKDVFLPNLHLLPLLGKLFPMKTITLKIAAPDQKGLVARITNFIFQNNGNILNLDQHTDSEGGRFFMRVEWDATAFKIAEKAAARAAFGAFLAQENIQADWQMFFPDERPRVAIFVSRFTHCLWDLLLRHKSGEFVCDIALIISNHEDARPVAETFGIPYEVVPITVENKKEAEKYEIALLKKLKVDLIVLARYMQVLTADFLAEFEARMINIHHSFLPAFKGAEPYQRAYKRGVKVIGATAHFLTEELDRGPIITQDVTRITHRDTVKDLITKGRDTERLVLSEAVKFFVQNRIFLYDGRTVIL